MFSNCSAACLTWTGSLDMANAISLDPLVYRCTGGASLRLNVWLATSCELELGSLPCVCDAVACEGEALFEVGGVENVLADVVFGLAGSMPRGGCDLAYGCEGAAAAGRAGLARPWSRRPAESTPGTRPPASLRVAAEIFGAIAALVGKGDARRGGDWLRTSSAGRG